MQNGRNDRRRSNDSERRNDHRRNDFNRNAESIFREQLQHDPRFGGGWAHDWDSNPDRENGSYRGGPRSIHWSDDRDYSHRRGHGFYADDDGGTVYEGGNRGRRDYGHGSSYAHRGYYDQGSYYEDARRYSPRFHERREYDQYDRNEELNGRRPNSPQHTDSEGFRSRDELSPQERGGRARDGYDPRDIGSNDRRDMWDSTYGRDQDSRFSSEYSDNLGRERWHQGDIDRGIDRRSQNERRGYQPRDPRELYRGRNTW